MSKAMTVTEQMARHATRKTVAFKEVSGVSASRDGEKNEEVLVAMKLLNRTLQC